MLILISVKLVLKVFRFPIEWLGESPKSSSGMQKFKGMLNYFEHLEISFSDYALCGALNNMLGDLDLRHWTGWYRCIGITLGLQGSTLFDSRDGSLAL